MRVTLFQFQYYRHLPLSAVYLASSLEKENIGFDLKLFDVNKFSAPGNNIETICSFLADSKEIIAAGCFSDMLPYVLVGLKKIKQSSPKKIIILGGLGPTLVAEEIFKEFDYIDFIIKGSGTLSLPKLVKRIQSKDSKFNDIPGALSRNKNSSVEDYSHDFFAGAPKVPAYHCIKNIKAYDTFLFKTSYGACPYKCTFCYVGSFPDKKIIYRDLNEAIEEIKLIKNIRGKGFLLRIIDEAFITNRKRVIEFCNLIRKNKITIQWACYGRINVIDEKLLKMMFSSGCRTIIYGIESGSNRVLKLIKKGFTIEEAKRAVLLTKKIIPHVTTCFIYRFPFETLNDFVDTVIARRYFKSRNISAPLYPLLPVKNTEIYQQYSRSLVSFNGARYDHMLCGNTVTLPVECAGLIRNHPRVFYNYGYYNSKDLTKISKFIIKNRNQI